MMLAAAILAAALAPAPTQPASDSAVTQVNPPLPADTAIDKRRYTLFHPTPRAALRDFSTDRPDTTESPFTVDAGHFQIEAGLAGYAFDRAGGTTTHTFDVLPVNLKLGLTNAVDLQVVFTPYQRIISRDGGVRTVTGGFGDDTQVRLKVNLWGNDGNASGGKTAFALMPFVKAPTGKTGIGNGHVEGGLILPLAVELPAGFSLGTMAEFDLTYDEERDDYGVDVVHTVTLGHPLIGPLEGYVEYIGVAPRQGGGGYRATASSGLVYGLAANWNVDAGGTVGLSGRTDDMTLFVGTSVRF